MPAHESLQREAFPLVFSGGHCFRPSFTSHRDRDTNGTPAYRKRTHFGMPSFPYLSHLDIASRDHFRNLPSLRQSDHERSAGGGRRLQGVAQYCIGDSGTLEGILVHWNAEQKPASSSTVLASSCGWPPANSEIHSNGVHTGRDSNESCPIRIIMDESRL